MKTSHCFLVLPLLFVFAFVSANLDDRSRQLVGKWKISDIKVTDSTGMSAQMVQTALMEERQLQYNYLADGTYEIKHGDIILASGKWSLSDDGVYLSLKGKARDISQEDLAGKIVTNPEDWKDYEAVFYIEKISDNEMIIIVCRNTKFEHRNIYQKL